MGGHVASASSVPLHNSLAGRNFPIKWSSNKAASHVIDLQPQSPATRHLRDHLDSAATGVRTYQQPQAALAADVADASGSQGVDLHAWRCALHDVDNEASGLSYD